MISPLQDLEDTLHPVVNSLVIPLFAFANAGIALGNIQISDIFHGISLAVFMGLLIGKFTGILLFAYLAVKTRWVSLPHGVTWKMIAGVSALAGIGFTVSMFIANLSYGSMPDGDIFLNQAKLGILIGSLTSGILGYILLNAFLPKKADEEDL